MIEVSLDDRGTKQAAQLGWVTQQPQIPFLEGGHLDPFPPSIQPSGMGCGCIRWLLLSGGEDPPKGISGAGEGWRRGDEQGT